MTLPVDRISLTGIAVDGIHGVFEWERRQAQRFVVDVIADLRRPSSTDDLSSTVDYAGLAAAVAADVRRDPVDLIETLAERIAGTCLAQKLIQRVEVTVHKPQAPMPVPVADVAVTIVRSRES